MKDANGKELKVGDFLIDALPVHPFKVVNVHDSEIEVTLFNDAVLNMAQHEIDDGKWMLCDSKGNKIHE